MPSRFTSFSLTLLLLLLTFILVSNTSEVVSDNNDDDLESIDELLAVDTELENESKNNGGSISSSSDLKLSEAEFVLVLGYAPWCARSADLMPHFAEAASLLKESGAPLLLAKVDADRFSESASFLGVKGFPTLLLYVNDTSQQYSGGFTADEIVLGSRKKTSTPIIRISSVTEAGEFLKKYHTFVIGLFEKFEGPEYEEFVRAAKSDNETQFVETSKFEVAQVQQNLWKQLSPSTGVGPEYEEFVRAAKSDNETQFVETSKFEVAQVLYPDISFFLELLRASLKDTLHTLVVLVLSAEVKPIWITSKQFYGVPYIWRMLHNFAGNIEMYTILDAIAAGPIEAHRSVNSTMVGVGMSMEGMKNQPRYMKFHHLWSSPTPSFPELSDPLALRISHDIEKLFS
ncbi:hypothetical protein RIF29_28144 [Crotalaria pallida]|uniref:Thioredoxin domain-containing protein n=1 Tax=Crotalaria pallida TaxID=3830 RepID=A0AAN9ERE1_CROPI